MPEPTATTPATPVIKIVWQKIRGLRCTVRQGEDQVVIACSSQDTILAAQTALNDMDEHAYLIAAWTWRCEVPELEGRLVFYEAPTKLEHCRPSGRIHPHR